MEKQHPSDIFRTNVLFMMAHKELSFEDVNRMKHPGISGTYLRQIIKGETKHPTTDKIRVMSDIFDLEPWMLILPNLPELVVGSLKADQLLQDYIAATPEAQRHIETTAKLAPKSQ